jgi:ATP-dependent DNA helicase 2 subunit 2
MYVVKHKPDPPATQSSQAQSQTQQSQSQVLASQAATQTQLNDIPEAEEEEELVDKEDIVKAYRFGSSWIPIEDDTFEPLRTHKGVEVLGFVPKQNVSRP